MNKRKESARTYWQLTRAPATNVALTLPMFVVYGLILLLAGGEASFRNGADLATSTLDALWKSAGWPLQLRPLVYAALLGVNLWMFRKLRKDNAFRSWILVPFAMECAAYAVITGIAASWAVHGLSRLTTHVALWIPLIVADDALRWSDIVLVSLGAGMHEELLFRLVGVGGGCLLWLGKGWRERLLGRHLSTRDVGKVLLLAICMSLTFSGMHHIVEPFTWRAFAFRSFAGLFFSALYITRGFATAAWTHTFYDMWVLSAL